MKKFAGILYFILGLFIFASCATIGPAETDGTTVTASKSGLSTASLAESGTAGFEDAETLMRRLADYTAKNGAEHNYLYAPVYANTQLSAFNKVVKYNKIIWQEREFETDDILNPSIKHKYAYRTMIALLNDNKFHILTEFYNENTDFQRFIRLMPQSDTEFNVEIVEKTGNTVSGGYIGTIQIAGMTAASGNTYHFNHNDNPIDGSQLSKEALEYVDEFIAELLETNVDFQSIALLK